VGHILAGKIEPEAMLELSVINIQLCGNCLASL
jgi:hypothetical protein